MTKSGKTHMRSKQWGAWMAIALMVHAYIPTSMAQSFGLSSRKKVAVVGFQHGEMVELEQSAYQNIRETMQAEDHLLVLDKSTVSQSLASQSSSRENAVTQKKVEEAYEQFIKGVESYQNLNLTQAIEQLSKAVKGYRASISALRDNHYLLYSHLYLGMALYFNGRQDEGQKFILEMIKLDPNRLTRTLPTRDFPPKIVEIHRALTKKIQQISDGQLEVHSVPSGATVLIDGMEVGKTPLTLSNIPQGKHFLGVDLAGHEFFSRLANIKSGAQRATARLQAEKMFYAKNQFEQEKNKSQEKLMQKVAKSLSVDTFVLGQVKKDSKDNVIVEMQSYDVATRKFSSVYAKTLSNKERKHASQYANLTNQWLNQQGLDQTKSSSTLMPDQDFSKDFQASKPPKTKKPGGSKKWLWIGLGAVAVGAGSALIFGGPGDATGNVLNVANPLAP